MPTEFDTNGLERICATPLGCGFAARGVAVARMWGDTGMPEVDVLRQIFGVATQDASGFAFVVVIDDDAHSPSKPVRDALSALIAEYQSQLRYWAACVCGRGVGASSKRTFMRLVMSFGGVRCPWTVAPESAEAVAWLLDKIGGDDVDADAQRLLAAIAAARPPATSG